MSAPARRSLLLPTEVALAAVTLAVVLGLARLFAGGGWFGPIAANALAAHVLVSLGRRRGLPLALVAIGCVPAAAIAVSWTSYWSTTTLGLPTSATATAAGDDLRGAWTLYKEVVAPTPAAAGFVVACSVAVWLVAYVADWAAFRVWVPFEATLPAGTLFLFTSMLGTARGRGWAVAAYAGAMVAFLLLHRLHRQDRSTHWVADRVVHGHRALLTAGGVLGVVAVVAGVALGPSLPGADSPGLVDPRSLAGDPPRTTVSPLVDIRGRLVEQSASVMFRVESTQPAYWRLTSLDRFDGEVWSSSSSYDDAEGELPVAVEPDVATEVVEQTYRVEGLAAIWLPSAFLPRTFRPVEGAPALYDERSATLIVDREAESSDGLVYEVTSTAPRVTADDLAGATAAVPGEIADDYLDLPEGFSPRVRALAQELTAGATGPYDAARRLQDHLRSFTYDLSVGPGHGGDAVESFLFDQQRGYCEQFAGAYAAMARAVGLPARVAVGFTQGEEDPAAPGTYVVRGEHAHAWPEVYVAGAGWVSFEPTPGRGQPFTEDYTGVPPQQVVTGDPVSSDTLPPTTAAPPIPSTADGQTRPPQDALETLGGSDPVDPGAPGGGGPSAVDRLTTAIAIALAVVSVLVLLLAIGVPSALLLRRHRRRAAAATPAERVAVAWAEAAEAAAMVGHVEQASLTPWERAERLAPRLTSEPARGAARRLADTLQAASYSAEGVDDLAAELAEEASAAVVAEVRAQATRQARLAHWLDPRPHLRRWRAERAARQRHITTTVRADLEVERELVGSADRG